MLAADDFAGIGEVLADLCLAVLTSGVTDPLPAGQSVAEAITAWDTLANDLEEVQVELPNIEIPERPSRNAMARA